MLELSPCVVCAIISRLRVASGDPPGRVHLLTISSTRQRIILIERCQSYQQRSDNPEWINISCAAVIGPGKNQGIGVGPICPDTHYEAQYNQAHREAHDLCYTIFDQKKEG